MSHGGLLDPIIWLFANPIILCPWYCLLSEIWNMNAEWRRTRAVQSDGGSNKKRITKVQAVGRTDLQVSEWETDLIHRGAKWITKSKGVPGLQSEREFITSWMSCLCFVYYTNSRIRAHCLYQFSLLSVRSYRTWLSFKEECLETWEAGVSFLSSPCELAF